MNLKKFPAYFLFAVILYALVLLAGLAYFIFPVISFGLAGEASFYFLALPMLMPLFLIIAYKYLKSEKWETILRLLFIAFTIIAAIILLYFIMIPLIG